MNKLIILIVAVLFSLNVKSQDEIKWYTIQEAEELQKETPKKIFVDVYTDWCGWCVKMDKTTFTNDVIVKHMNTNYYPVKFDAEGSDVITFNGTEYKNPNPGGRRSTHELAQALLNGRMSYPSYVFIDENNNLLTVIPGYSVAKEFEPILHFFTENAYQDQKWPDFKASFKGNVE